MKVLDARLLQECADNISAGAAVAALAKCTSGIGAFHAAGCTAWS